MRQKKLSRAERFHLISEMMDAEPGGAQGHIPHRFICIEQDNSQRIFYEKRGPHLQMVSASDIAPVILRYSHDRQSAAPDGMSAITYRDSIEAAHYWMNNTRRVNKNPPLFVNATDTSLGYVTLPWDLDEGSGTDLPPTFEGIFKRIHDRRAAQAWIGSLFCAGSDRSQYLWLYGEGSNGKSRISDFLMRLMGPVACPANIPSDSNRFWTASLIGKRLVVLGEAENYEFVNTSLLKQLTGDHYCACEVKNGPQFNASMICKLYFHSNKKPALDGSNASMRRAIYSPIEPLPPSEMRPTHEFDDLLWEEGRAFVSACVALYKEMCPDHGPIPTVEEPSRDLVDVNNEKFAAVADKWFLFIEGQEIRPAQMQEIFKQESFLKYKPLQNKFYAYLERMCGVRKLRVRDNNYVYTGARVKTSTEFKDWMLANSAPNVYPFLFPLDNKGENTN